MLVLRFMWFSLVVFMLRRNLYTSLSLVGSLLYIDFDKHSFIVYDASIISLFPWWVLVSTLLLMLAKLFGCYIPICRLCFIIIFAFNCSLIGL